MHLGRELFSSVLPGTVRRTAEKHPGQDTAYVLSKGGKEACSRYGVVDKVEQSSQALSETRENNASRTNMQKHHPHLVTDALSDCFTGSGDPPADKLEVMVQSIVAEHLHMDPERLSVTENVFKGVSSMMQTADIYEELRTVFFQGSIPAEFFRSTTIREMAAFIGKKLILRDEEAADETLPLRNFQAVPVFL